MKKLQIVHTVGSENSDDFDVLVLGYVEPKDGPAEELEEKAQIQKHYEDYQKCMIDYNYSFIKYLVQVAGYRETPSELVEVEVRSR